VIYKSLDLNRPQHWSSRSRPEPRTTSLFVAATVITVLVPCSTDHAAYSTR